MTRPFRLCTHQWMDITGFLICLSFPLNYTMASLVVGTFLAFFMLPMMLSIVSYKLWVIEYFIDYNHSTFFPVIALILNTLLSKG